MRFDWVRLDVANQCLWRGRPRVSLMPKPFAVLQYLVEHPGRLVTHDQLLGAIWPNTYSAARKSSAGTGWRSGVRSAIAPKRHKACGETKRGYQFIAAVTEDSPLPARENASPAANHLVGRSAPLAGLDRCLIQALDGRRQVVFVVGEPGIGKTSLVDAFQHASAPIAGVTVAPASQWEGFGGKEAYYPLLEAIGPARARPAPSFPWWSTRSPPAHRPG